MTDSEFGMFSATNLDPTNYGKATAGNNRKIHAIRLTFTDYYVTFCGVRTARAPQSTQERLAKCQRCF